MIGADNEILLKKPAYDSPTPLKGDIFKYVYTPSWKYVRRAKDREAQLTSRQ
jgi:hypothetical protein